jgi:hypothetical protein
MSEKTTPRFPVGSKVKVTKIPGTGDLQSCLGKIGQVLFVRGRWREVILDDTGHALLFHEEELEEV